MSNINSLAGLGWRAFFQQQLTIDEWEDAVPARVVEQHRSELVVATATTTQQLPLQHAMTDLVVGDWILLDNSGLFVRSLERKSCFVRKAPGSQLKKQLISANVDTAFIVCSMNDDFNLSRIERYLSLVHESGADAVVLLSKSDQCDEPENFVRQVQQLDSLLPVLPVNCLNSEMVSELQPWISEGSTIAVMGSSGVGKSTLVNTLMGEQRQDTRGIREDDAKGRHTTTSRSLISLPSGGLILDTPGMREIQLVDSREGISATFADVESFAERCRYGDCQHLSEPGCAVLAAIESGAIEQRRLDNYLKLLREDAVNSASVAQKRATDKALGKYYKRAQSEGKKLKGR